MDKEESWICIDGHGDERIFPRKPHRTFPNMDLEVMWGKRRTTDPLEKEYLNGILLPKGTIRHLIGKNMTYNNEPIKIL